MQAALDSASYPKGVTPTQEDYDSTFLVRHDFHGEWNYTVQPRTTDDE